MGFQAIVIFWTSLAALTPVPRESWWERRDAELCMRQFQGGGAHIGAGCMDFGHVPDLANVEAPLTTGSACLAVFFGLPWWERATVNITKALRC